MCTVSIIKDSQDRLILTSNRDEKVLRSTSPPEWKFIGDQMVTYPKDEEKGGTWIALGSGGIVACLLNGAFQKHFPRKEYSMSRGQIVLDVFKYNSIDTFLKDIELIDVEPFTLLFLNTNDQDFVSELVWDGERKYTTKKALDRPLLWCSSTLYTDEIRNRRKLFFNQWSGSVEQVNLQTIHALHAADTGTNGFLFDNPDDSLRTVSITQILIERKIGTMHYHDLIQSKHTIKHQLWN